MKCCMRHCIPKAQPYKQINTVPILRLQLLFGSNPKQKSYVRNNISDLFIYYFFCMTSEPKPMDSSTTVNHDHL